MPNTKRDLLITAVVKARNEENNIAECIASLQNLVDEVIVVDDHSSDDTAKIASALGATVLVGEPHGGFIDRLDIQGFVAANGKYILRLDADERMTPGLARELRSVAEDGEFAGVSYARRYWFFDGWVDHGGWTRSHQLGFFHSDAWDRNWSGDLHSQVPIVGRVLTIPFDVQKCMLHYDYDTVTEFVQRSLVSYARLEAMERVRDGYTFSAKAVARSAFRRSFGTYVIRRGYKDGVRGAVVASLLAAYEICVAAYAWEVVNRNKNIEIRNNGSDGLRDVN